MLNTDFKENINTDAFDLLSETEKCLLVDSHFKTLFSEPKVAMAFIKALMPFIGDDYELNKYVLYGDKDISKLNISERQDYLINYFNNKITSISNKTSNSTVLFDYTYGKNNNIVTINLEMQNNNPSDYSCITRAVYYNARILANLLDSGENYNKLHKTYSIWLLNFNYFKDDNAIHILSNCNFISKNCKLSSNNLEYTVANNSYLKEADLTETVFIELPKLHNIPNKNLRKFLETLRNVDKKYSLKDKLVTLCDLDEEEVDYMIKNVNQYTKNDREFIELGLKEGLAKGEINGETKKQKEIITNMYNNNFDLNTISIATNTSIQEIKEILNLNN